MDEALRAGKGERTAARLGYRSGHHPRILVTRLVKLELRVPQVRQVRFSTELFERYQRNEKALVAALMEMYVQGMSTRRAMAITEKLCGHEFGASAMSAINQKLGREADALHDPASGRRVYLRDFGRVLRAGAGGPLSQSHAVLITLRIGWGGYRHVLLVELATGIAPPDAKIICPR